MRARTSAVLAYGIASVVFGTILPVAFLIPPDSVGSWLMHVYGPSWSPSFSRRNASVVALRSQ